MPPVGKIAQLPDELRQWLHNAFVERRFGQIEQITEDLNALLKQGGIAVSVGKSAVGAESQRVKRAQASMMAITKMAQEISSHTRDDAAARSQVPLAMLEGEYLTLMMDMQQAEAEEDLSVRADLLNRAALGMHRMSKASMSVTKHRLEYEARAKEAAEAVAKIAKTGGLQPAQVDEIRAQILGITKKAA